MATITIGSNSYFSYATVAEADDFLLVDPNYTTWNALDTDGKGRLLIQSTRFLDSLSYIESADTQAERELIDAFSVACIMIAGLLSTGDISILGGTANVGSNDAKRYKAGSVEIENFRNFNSFYLGLYSTVFPPNIYAILKPYLISSTSNIPAGANSFDTDGVSSIQNYEVIYP